MIDLVSEKNIYHNPSVIAHRLHFVRF